MSTKTIGQLESSNQLDINDFIAAYNAESLADNVTYKTRISDVLALKTISVNGKTGSTITITSDDISDASSAKKFVSGAEKNKIGLLRTDQGSSAFLAGDGTYKAVDLSYSGQTFITTASNLGGVGLYANKVGSTLQFKGLIAGSNVTLTPTASGITISASVSGGSATVTGAANGLTLSSGVIKLGGTMTGNTTITTSTGSRLSVAGWPVQYATDLSSSYGVRSLVDKGFVTGLTSTLGSGTTGATNGLSLSGKKIKLGGTITGATTLTVGTSQSLNIQHTDGSSNYHRFYIGDGGAMRLTTLNSSGNGTNMTFLSGSISIGTNLSSFAGITYDSDISANYTNRSLVDKEFVLTAIASGSSSTTFTNGNGTTAGATAINLGGAITGDTIFTGANTHNLFFGQAGGEELATINFYTTGGYNEWNAGEGFISMYSNSASEGSYGSIAVAPGYIEMYGGGGSLGLGSFSLGSSFNVSAAGGVNISSNDGQIQFIHYNAGAGGNTSITITTGSTAIVDSTIPTFEGVKYGQDFSANYTERSLIDKGYADTIIDAAVSAVTSLKYVRIIKSDVPNYSFTSITTEEGTRAILIPANTVGVGDIVTIKVLNQKTGSNAKCDHRLRIHTTNSVAGSTLIGLWNNGASTAAHMIKAKRELFVISSTQTLPGTDTADAVTDDGVTATASTLNIDWTVNQYIVLTSQLASGSDTAKLLSYTVNVTKKAV